MRKILVVFLLGFWVSQLLLHRGRGMALNAGVDEAEGTIERSRQSVAICAGRIVKLSLLELVEVEAAECSGPIPIPDSRNVFLQEIPLVCTARLKRSNFVIERPLRYSMSAMKPTVNDERTPEARITRQVGNNGDVQGLVVPHVQKRGARSHCV